MYFTVITTDNKKFVVSEKCFRKYPGAEKIKKNATYFVLIKDKFTKKDEWKKVQIAKMSENKQDCEAEGPQAKRICVPPLRHTFTATDCSSDDDVENEQDMINSQPLSGEPARKKKDKVGQGNKGSAIVADVRDQEEIQALTLDSQKTQFNTSKEDPVPSVIQAQLAQKINSLHNALASHDGHVEASKEARVVLSDLNGGHVQPPKEVLKVLSDLNQQLDTNNTLLEENTVLLKTAVGYLGNLWSFCSDFKGKLLEKGCSGSKSQQSCILAPHSPPTGPKVLEVCNGKRHLGFGIWMNETAYQTVLDEASGQNPHIKYIKALALKVLGLRIMATTTVSGTPSRCKNKGADAPVKPKCQAHVKNILLMNVLRAAYRAYLQNLHPQATVEKLVSAMNRPIGNKMSWADAELKEHPNYSGKATQLFLVAEDSDGDDDAAINFVETQYTMPEDVSEVEEES